MDEAKKMKKISRLKTQDLAFVGLSIAVMAVSAWISIPFGLVPFTLQTFAMLFALLTLKPRQCIAAVVGYLVIGALGVPVFSSMRGGIGILAGPSGGFLWGNLWGVVFALAVLSFFRASAKKNQRAVGFVPEMCAAILFLVLTYACGWAQLCVVASLEPTAAFVSSVAPFLIAEPFKLAAALACARAVRRVVR